MAAAPSQPSPDGSFSQARDTEARTAASSAPSESIMLGLSSSEDVLSIDAGDIGDSPAISPWYEEIMEVVSHAVSKLITEWPAEKQEMFRKSKLDEHHKFHVGAYHFFHLSVEIME